MLCSKCGQENENRAKFCVRCGAELESREADSTISFTSIEEAEEEEAVVEEEPLPGERIVLVVKKGPIVGQRFPIESKEITLGRDPQSDIFLNDITVSRKHAKIATTPDGIIITDVGSLNGTYVNGKRVESTFLKHGDELQIGKFKLIFLTGGTL